MNREKMIEVSLFLLRVFSSIIFIQAGGLKLFGWFGGMPGGMELNTMLTIAGILEVFGGLALLLGLFTRPVAFLLSGEMAVAYFIGHFPSGFWPIQNGGQAAVLLCFIFLFFATYGAGKWSVDQYIKLKHQNLFQRIFSRN